MILNKDETNRNQDCDRTNTYAIQVSPDDIYLGSTARKVKVKKGSKKEMDFDESIKAELDGLLKDGTFVPIHQ